MTRKASFRAKMVAFAVGGSLLHITGGFGGFGGWGSCVSNTATQRFYTNSGNAVIDTVADSAANLGGDFNTIVFQPAAGFLSDLWTTYVDLRIADDPVFERRLVD